MIGMHCAELREIGVSYCVHNVTTAVLPSTKPMETLCSGHIIYTIGHSYFPNPLDSLLKKKKYSCLDHPYTNVSFLRTCYCHIRIGKYVLLSIIVLILFADDDDIQP